MAKVKAHKTASKSNGPVDIRTEFRKLGILIEHLTDNFRAVREQYSSINRKLDQHTRMLQSHTQILAAHSRLHDSHSAQLTKHSGILASHTEMIANIAMDLTIVKQNVESIKDALKRKIDFEEFVALERRVALLERRR